MKTRARITLPDLLVIALVAAALGALLAAQWPGDTAAVARVYVDGEAELELALDRDGQYPVQGPLGESLLEVADGRIRFREAPCSNRVCLQRGWLSRDGASASCIPNRIHVRLVRGDESYDSIHY